MESAQQILLTERLANARTLHHKQTLRSEKLQAAVGASRPVKVTQALNCIVDESALLAGLKEPIGDNLKQWIRTSAVNLFVPLYTLERLRLLRSGPAPTNVEARRALEWLDQITSTTEHKSAGRVQLQGPDDQYMSWHDVETYLLPETPLSSHNGPDGLDGISDAFEENVRIREEGRGSRMSSEVLDHPSPPSANSKGAAIGLGVVAPSWGRSNGITHLDDTFDCESTKSGDNTNSTMTTTNGAVTASIPPRVRPLLNFVVWRTHNQDPSIAGSGKYILLTNDAITQKQAQKFGVRAKLLGQVRAIIARDANVSETPTEIGDSVETKNEQSVHLEDEDFGASVSNVDDDDEDEVVFNPSQRPISRVATPPVNLWDPDHFGRTPAKDSKSGQSPKIGSIPFELATPPSPHSVSRVPTIPAANRTPAQPVRGNHGGGSTRGSPMNRRRGSPRLQHVQARPIDPNSYVRPPPALGRGRGGRGKLWEPTT